MMYTIWLRQYLLATRTGVEMLSNVYMEWSKGVAQLTAIGMGLPVSDEHFDDAWLEPVFEAIDRRTAHVADCRARLYLRYGFNPAGASANADDGFQPAKA